MKVLAIQLNQPGDAILTTPAWRWMMEQGHELHVLVQPVSAQLLKSMPGLGGVHPLPRGSFQISRDIRRWRQFHAIGFDWTLVFSRCSERPALWARLSGAPVRSALLNENFPKLLSPFRMINNWRRYPVNVFHVVEQHLALAGAPAKAAESARLEYHPDTEALAWRDGWLKQNGLKHGGYLHFHLTARWPSKCWPMSHVCDFLAVATKAFPLPLVVTTGPASFEKNYGRQALHDFPKVVSEIGTLQPNQLGAIVEGAAVFLGMDSMPMHLAAALQKPGIALFGSTDSSQWGPWHAPIEVIHPVEKEKRMAAIFPADVVKKLHCVIMGLR
jgi:heptosyltransferase-3